MPEDEKGKAVPKGCREVACDINGHRVAILERVYGDAQGGEVDPDDDEESSGFLLSQMFDEDVTLAAITGWRIWEASSTFVKLLSGDLVDCIRGRKCIELGCGTGFVGLCAAAAGGHVLLTDVASVVRDSAAHNLRRNSGSEVSASGDGAAAAEWAGARNVGLGTAAATPLDWCKPVGAQIVQHDFFSADVVLACDCIWLMDILEPFVDTLAALCKGPSRPTAFVTYEERGKQGVEDEQRTFTKLEDVAAALDSRGLAWDVYYDGQEERAFWQGEAAVAMKRALVLRVSAQ